MTFNELRTNLCGALLFLLTMLLPALRLPAQV